MICEPFPLMFLSEVLLKLPGIMISLLPERKASIAKRNALGLPLCCGDGVVLSLCGRVCIIDG